VGKKQSSSSPDKPTRGTREETTTRILDAAEELFASRNPGDVTVREIAEHAGVTHALVHQYVGSKDDLFNAVVQRNAPDRQAVIREVAEFRAVLDRLFPDVLDRRLHSLTMIRSAMDGVEYTSLQERITTGQMLVQLARESAASGSHRQPAPPEMDARVVVAAVIALGYGWVGLESWLLQICDLQDADPAEVRRQLVEIAQAIGDLVLPPNGASPAA